jgi:hypothetical protein
VSEETQFSGKEVGFGLVAVNAGLTEGLKDSGAVLFVFLHVL